MDAILNDIKKALEKFYSSVEKDMVEVRRSKQEVQQLKSDFFNEMMGGKYIRDDHRIVISAPEIVIGNVDKSGVLFPGGYSHITIRGNQIALDGVAADCSDKSVGGSIVSRASNIRQIAVDPGIDGNENVVLGQSAIVNQANSIVLHSTDAEGVLFNPMAVTARGGIYMHADQTFVIEAAKSNEIDIARLDKAMSELNDSKKELKKKVDEQKSVVSDLLKEMESLLGDDEGYADDMETISNNIEQLTALQELTRIKGAALTTTIVTYLDLMSKLAEVNRNISSMKKRQAELKDAKANYQKESTGARLDVCSEVVSVRSVDGDGNVRTNKGAGMYVLANNVDVRSRAHDGTLLPDSAVSIMTNHVNVATFDVKYKDQEKRSDADVPLMGDVTITSKNVTIQSIDQEMKEGKVSEKALTKDGIINLRAETIDVSATDTEGKATGSVGLNAKQLKLRSFNVKKNEKKDDGKDGTSEAPKDDKLCEGSSLLISSEKVIIGSKDKSNKTKTMQLAADNMGVFGDTTTEVQQGDGKALLQLTDGNAAIGGGKIQMYGDTTINGKLDLNGEMKAPKATIDNIEAKSSFKSPNITDGIAVPAPSAPGSKLNAKLKAEEIKEE